MTAREFPFFFNNLCVSRASQPAQAMKDGAHVLKYPRSDHFCNIVEGFASLVSHIGVLKRMEAISQFIHPSPPSILSHVQSQSSSEKHTKMGWVIFWAQDMAQSSAKGGSQWFPPGFLQKFTDFNFLRHPWNSSSHQGPFCILSWPNCLQHKGQFTQGNQAIDSIMGPWANRFGPTIGIHFNHGAAQIFPASRPSFPARHWSTTPAWKKWWGSLVQKTLMDALERPRITYPLNLHSFGIQPMSSKLFKQLLSTPLTSKLLAFWCH